MKRHVHHSSLVILLTALLSIGLQSGCSNLSNTEKGAAVGVGAGAVVGGVIGHAVGSTAKGAIVGAVVGGAAGAIIGQQMDKQAEELDAELENAEVSRVGEGIVVTFDSGILFDFDSAELGPQAQTNLSELGQSLADYDNTEVLIVGHTDAEGTDAYNATLSEQRATSAAEHLMEMGIRPSRVSTMGKGETDPIASNETDAGRRQNRRVEVVIYAGEEFREAVQEQSGSMRGPAMGQAPGR